MENVVEWTLLDGLRNVISKLPTRYRAELSVVPARQQPGSMSLTKCQRKNHPWGRRQLQNARQNTARQSKSIESRRSSMPNYLCPQGRNNIFAISKLRKQRKCSLHALHGKTLEETYAYMAKTPRRCSSHDNKNSVPASFSAYGSPSARISFRRTRSEQNQSWPVERLQGESERKNRPCI